MERIQRVGGLAPLITLSIYLSQFAVIGLTGLAYPITPEQWFMLFNQNTFLGLVYLNAADGFSIAVLGLLYLGLHREFNKFRPARSSIALYLALIGVAIFVATRAIMVTGTLTLSSQYQLAATGAEQDVLLAAGAAVMSITRATPETWGFLFLAMAGAQFCSLFWEQEAWPNWHGYLGLIALSLTVANDLSVAFWPAAAPILMIFNGLLWFVWWISVGLELRRRPRLAANGPRSIS